MTVPTTVSLRDAAGAADPLRTAQTIGARLVETAVWSGGRCNWVGAEPLERVQGDRAPAGDGRLTYRALGPDLYAGSSGIALFLAELCAATGQEEFRTTALAAMRHALSHGDDVKPVVRLGFYVGWSGVALAALRTGLLLGADDLVEAGSAVLRDVGVLVHESDAAGGDLDDTHEFDLVAGRAGAVIALATGYRLLGDECLLAGAALAAEQLVRSARHSRAGWSWRSPGLRNQRNLTGLSHGAAGVAVALIEAYRLTIDESLAAGARAAMAYENHWLDPREGNWPDFRENRAKAGSARGQHTFSTLWCHGAPGIALSRLHAYEFLREPGWREDACLALSTTARKTRHLVEAGGMDFSLCHGLAGNVEAILEGRRVLGAGAVSLDTVHTVVQHGVERYASTGLAWPCGTHTDETPNLMLGLAGIGHFYLRVAASSTPSVLLPTNFAPRQ